MTFAAGGPSDIALMRRGPCTAMLDMPGLHARPRASLRAIRPLVAGRKQVVVAVYDLAEGVGLAVAALSCASFVPQILKLTRHRDASGGPAGCAGARSFEGFPGIPGA
jgi:hypothetical protein